MPVSRSEVKLAAWINGELGDVAKAMSSSLLGRGNVRGSEPPARERVVVLRS